MAVPKLLMGLAAIVLLALGMSAVLGVGMFATATILVSVFAVLLLQSTGYFNPFAFLKGNMNWYATIVIGLIAFFYGAFAIIPAFGPMLTPAAFTAAAAGGGAIMPGTTGAVAPTAAGLCLTTAELAGKDSVATILVYNREADSPYSSAIAAGQVDVYYQLDNGPVVRSKATNTISGTVGEKLTIWGAGDNTSNLYYYDTKEICLTKQADQVEVSAHNKTKRTSLLIACYDKTGSASCSGGTDTGEEDFDFTLGAGQVEKLYLELTVNNANTAYNLYAIGILTYNDINSMTPQDAVWTPALVPKFLKNVKIANSSSGHRYNISDFENMYTLSAPTMLHEWQSMKYAFTIQAGTTDPTTSAQGSSSDMAVMCFFDGAYSRSADSTMKFGFYTDDSSQANVGYAEQFTQFIGKYDCVGIEGI